MNPERVQEREKLKALEAEKKAQENKTEEINLDEPEKKEEVKEEKNNKENSKENKENIINNNRQEIADL